MGFDNECILNIQSLPGEYFCPVCRLLVLPNEALQAQCTHLYCKPCMAYTANSTRACPYDGYLVTELDAKPLPESNKALADTINKIAVHCLYHRSGCTWQGPLLECVTHCSGCAFGNSPVVCNRCALQIVHRQVQEHAQTCPGVQPQAQPIVQTQEATSANAAATVQSQTANPILAGPVSSQVVPQTATTITPTQDPKQQPNSSTQGAEQWYQQQYYQQFGGYEAYQQQYQQFYQQAASQPQLYPQMQAQPHLQTQAPLPSNPQAPSQPLTSHSQNQSQAQSQPHEQPLSSIQPQAPPSQVQSVMGSQPLNQQQQIQSTVPANQQLQMQNHPSQQYPHAQIQVQQYPSQSYPQQHGQMPAYQQPQVLQLPQLLPQGRPHQQLPPQGHPQQLPPQGHPQQLPPQVHLQQQLPPQLHPQQQLPPQLHPQQQLPPQLHPQQQLPSQVHPQQQLLAEVHHQQQLLPHQQAPQGQSSQQLQAQQQIPTLNPLPQSKIQKTQGVTGYQSYPPLQSHPTMQTGGSLQQQVPVRPPQTTQSIQVQGHLPQPSSQIHPPQFQQQQGLLRPPNLPNAPPAQHPNYHLNQQAGQVVPQRGVMQPVQQHMAPQIGQHQQPPLGGQHLGTTHNQFDQRPLHTQISPQGLLHPYQSQQNVFGPNSMQPSHASQNPARRPLMPAYGAADHFALSTPVRPQVRPMQSGYGQNNMDGFSNQAPPVKNVTGRHASLPQTSAKMDKKSLATDSGQKRAGISEFDGKNPVTDHKGVTEDDKPGQTKPAGTVEEVHTINGLQASENGETSVNQAATDDSVQRIEEPLDGKVGEVSADKKDDPTSDPKAEEKEVVEDKANVDGRPQGTPVQQNDLEGQSHIGGGLIAHPSSSERNALHHMQRQASGFSHEGGPFKQKNAASSLLDPTPTGSLHQPNAPARILNHVRPQLTQSHPPHLRMAPTEHFVAETLPNAFEAPNQRPFLFDGRQSGPNLPGAAGLNGQHSDFHSNVSMFSQRDEKLIYLPDEHMKYPVADPSRRGYDRVFDDELKNSGEHITKFESYLSSGRPLGRGPFDNAVRGPSFNPEDAASASLRIFPHDRERGPFEPHEWNSGKLDSSKRHTDGFSSGYSRHHLDRFLPRSPGREYDGFRSRFLDLHNRYAPDDLVRRDMHGPSGPIASSLPESRFPSLPGPFRKSEFDERFRGSEHMSSGDLMGRDIFPSHIHRGELSGPGRLSNHLRMGEPGGLSSFHDRPHRGEFVGPEIFGARIGEPGHKSTFPLPTYLDEATYRGDVETFDGLRKRRAISMGWCRLCKVDCETVEGLDVHSQSREHQEMAMDMVRSIKQQNAKKQKQSSSAKFSFGNVSQTRTSNSDVRGNKH